MKTTQLTIDDVKKMFSGLNIITIFTQFFGYSTKRTVYSKGYEVNDRNNLCVCLCKEYKGDFYTWFHIPGCTTCSDSSTLMNTDTMRALLVRRYFYMWVDAENAAEREVHCSKCNDCCLRHRRPRG